MASVIYAELSPDGKRRFTVAQMGAELGVTCPTIYRHLPALVANERVAAARKAREVPTG